MTLRITLAQINTTVGDFDGNVAKIIDAAHQAEENQQAELVVFPELTVTGYPPEDLLLRPDFINQAWDSVQRLCQSVTDIGLVIGFPHWQDNKLYNSAAFILNGKIEALYHKQKLPNYGVFDEQRYFAPGDSPCLFHYKNTALALAVCEDIWHDDVVLANKAAGADIILTLNASPFHAGKIHQREQVVCDQAKTNHIAIVYVNQVGGQDELVFDGASFVTDANGHIIFRAQEFEEQISTIQFSNRTPAPADCAPLYQPVASEYKALVLGVKDYVRKNGFKGALLGLSGGIDSALVLAIAVDALGADNVDAVLMPSHYTQDMSNEDAIKEARALGVNYHIIPIEPAVIAFNDMLSPIFEGQAKDITEENIQARCRGIILMALSNKQGKLLLTTGNKSEMSVGYATLYGDMAGGFAPIKDVPKLLVYKLAEYRNQLSPVIPQRVIDRPPSAELAPDQIDADSLPPYDVLDPILEMYVKQDKSAADIIAAGFDPADVERAISLVDRNEYKRRQAPPGIRITPRAFGRDRRYPLASAYRGTQTLTHS